MRRKAGKSTAVTPSLHARPSSKVHHDLKRRAFLQGIGTTAGATVLASTIGTPFAAYAQQTGGKPSGSPAPRRGGRVTLLVNPEPNVLINFATTAGAEDKASPKITEGLLAYDFDVQPQPQLATKWEISSDGLQYTFHLRENVRWHDGKPFTSQDVAQSIKLLQTYHPRGRATFANVTGVDTPDAHTAVLRLSRPAPYLLYALAASESPIVPAHLYANGDPLNNPNNTKPIGTGPYLFKEWVRGSHVRLVRNPDYWDAPKPYVDELWLTFIPDAAARAASLETGELDLAGENPVPLTDIARLTKEPHLQLETRGYSYDAALTQLVFNLDNPYLKDVHVRHAIGHAIDRQAILRSVFYGYGVPSPAAISPLLSQFYDAAVESYPYDPALAEKLLDDAGYRRKGDAQSFRFPLTIDYNPYDPSFQLLAQFLRQSLRRVGIDATVRSQDFPTYVKRVFTDRAFDIDANFMGNTFDPTVGVQRIYWSKNFKPGVPFSNASHYENADADRLLEAAAVAVDRNKRIEIFKEFQLKVADDLPVYNLITLKQVTLYNKRVHGHTVTADGLCGNLAGLYVDA